MYFIQDCWKQSAKGVWNYHGSQELLRSADLRESKVWRREGHREEGKWAVGCGECEGKVEGVSWLAALQEGREYKMCSVNGCLLPPHVRPLEPRSPLSLEASQLPSNAFRHLSLEVEPREGLW